MEIVIKGSTFWYCRRYYRVASNQQYRAYDFVQSVCQAECIRGFLETV